MIKWILMRSAFGLEQLLTLSAHIEIVATCFAVNFLGFGVIIWHHQVGFRRVLHDINPSVLPVLPKSSMTCNKNRKPNTIDTKPLDTPEIVSDYFYVERTVFVWSDFKKLKEINWTPSRICLFTPEPQMLINTKWKMVGSCCLEPEGNKRDQDPSCTEHQGNKRNQRSNWEMFESYCPEP